MCFHTILSTKNGVINKEWCNNAAVISKHCSSLVEFMFVKCRPFYLPREFTAIVIAAVYIPPCANAKDALRELYSAISEQQTNNPDGFFIIAGDFNHANLKTVLPKFYQHVNFATRGNNTLDFVYTTGKNAYKAEPRPHLGYSDHISVMLIPAYRPLLKLAKPVQKLITIWPDDATSTLQDCFQCTDWNMFKEAATYNNHTDLHEYTETVTAYIKKCIDDVTVTKTITTRANQKPWMTAEVRGLLKTRDEAFRSGDKAALKTARANLSCGIKNAKRSYAQKINNHFTDSRDTRSLWQAIQTITDYKPPPQACDEDTSLPDALNHFYSRFEMQNDTPAQKLPTPPNDRALCLSPADVRKTLSRINPRKAAGPDNIPGRVLKDCAAQLTDVLTDIFNTSLSQAVVPTCLKSTTIIPVPKKSPVSCLNDYRPIALTPIMMKCFERLVMNNIKNSLPNTLDPLQFAYRPNRSTDDAISSTLHLALTHLENKDSYVRMLFIDFSSAFNTIIPQQLINKLNLLGLNNSLCNWILDFLTGRPQSVRVGHNTSSTTTLSTGAPQGCVLSPLLFTLLTHDCTAKFSSNHIIKFADDTTVVGLISNNDETHYREEVAQLAEWCGANNLSLNVEKTKEVVMDFRRNSVDHPHWPSTVRLWRESAALNSWGCTSQRISPGPPTPCHSPRRHNSAYTFSAGWKEQVSHHPSSTHSTGAPLRVCWPAASLSGTGTAVLLTARPSSGQWTRLQRSSVPLSHPSWTFSLHDAPAKPTASWRTPPTPPTVSSSSYHQEDGTGASEPAPPDCSTAFSPRLWEPWTQITPPPSETPCNPLPPETWTIPPPPSPNIPQPYHTKEQNVNFFCAIQVCYTQVSGPVQTTCSNTLSSMH